MTAEQNVNCERASRRARGRRGKLNNTDRLGLHECLVYKATTPEKERERELALAARSAFFRAAGSKRAPRHVRGGPSGKVFTRTTAGARAPNLLSPVNYSEHGSAA